MLILRVITKNYLEEDLDLDLEFLLKGDLLLGYPLLFYLLINNNKNKFN